MGVAVIAVVFCCYLAGTIHTVYCSRVVSAIEEEIEKSSFSPMWDNAKGKEKVTIFLKSA